MDSCPIFRIRYRPVELLPLDAVIRPLAVAQHRDPRPVGLLHDADELERDRRRRRRSGRDDRHRRRRRRRSGRSRDRRRRRRRRRLGPEAKRVARALGRLASRLRQQRELHVGRRLRVRRRSASRRRASGGGRATRQPATPVRPSSARPPAPSPRRSARRRARPCGAQRPLRARPFPRRPRRPEVGGHFERQRQRRALIAALGQRHVVDDEEVGRRLEVVDAARGCRRSRRTASSRPSADRATSRAAALRLVAPRWNCTPCSRAFCWKRRCVIRRAAATSAGSTFW